jgi:hypothetical protein
MMVTPETDDHMEFIRNRSIIENLTPLDYSAGLKNFVQKLMELEHGDERNKIPQIASTTSLCNSAFEAFVAFTVNDDLEGKNMITAWDEALEQKQEDQQVADGNILSSHHMNQILEKHDANFGDQDSTYRE